MPIHRRSRANTHTVALGFARRCRVRTRLAFPELQSFPSTSPQLTRATWAVPFGRTVTMMAVLFSSRKRRASSFMRFPSNLELSQGWLREQLLDRQRPWNDALLDVVRDHGLQCLPVLPDPVRPEIIAKDRSLPLDLGHEPGKRARQHVRLEKIAEPLLLGRAKCLVQALRHPAMFSI